MGYYDPETGEHIPCEVFVGVLPFSGFIYAGAVHSQQQPDFVKALGNSLNYLGGVPASVLCDNLKAAVKKSDRYEPKFTELIEQLSLHYRTTFLATRPRKPRDKASVEGAVKLVYQRIFAPLRNSVFDSLEALNNAIHKQLDVLNDRLMYKRQHSRRQLFETNEKSLLQSLPDQLFEVRKTIIAKVQKNYHIILGQDWHQYSVPYQFTGQKVTVTYTAEQVEVYHDLKRIALHKRNPRSHGYTTLEDHMPANHRHYHQQKGWDANYFKKQASQIGPATNQAISIILTSRAFPEQTFNSCLGVLRLANKYGNDRLEAACKRVVTAGGASYQMIKNILQKKLDQMPEQGTLDFTTPSHDNLRGAQNYC
jgi:transposase